MLNKHQNSVCAFAESLVACLYDEASLAEKAAFEAHLVNCAACGDEVKEFGALRAAVHEWRAADYDRLPTPIFEIPAPPLRPAANVEKSASWFEELKRIFSFKPALAMSGLLILIALFGVAAFVFNFRTDAPVAENIKEKTSVKTSVSPTVEEKSDVSPDAAVVADSKETEIAISNPPLKIEDQKPATPKNAAPKVSTAAAKNAAPKAAPTDAKRNPKPKSAAPTDVPRLIEAGNEEDDSIRLADLFEEIGTE